MCVPTEYTCRRRNVKPYLLLISAALVPVVQGTDFANAGFEEPNLPPGTFQPNPPSSQTVWQFEANSGIANGRGSWGTGGHSGLQYAYLQSNANPGRVSQTVTGLLPGQQYRVRFWMARRNGNVGANEANSIQVRVDNQVIFLFTRPFSAGWYEYGTEYFTASNTFHEFTFIAEQTDADRSSLIDDVHLEEGRPPFGPLENNSFERPTLSPGEYVENPNTIDTVWRFRRQSGLANGRGAWGTGAQSGEQYAYLQNDGEISQTVGGLEVGEPYHIRFFMARRNGIVGPTEPNPIRVLLDGNALTPFIMNSSPEWAEYVTPFFRATSAAHLITFQGAPPAGDRTTLIDNVSIDQHASVSPTAFTIFRGVLISGGLAEILHSDDVYMYVRPGATLSSAEAPVQIILEGTAPFTTASFVGFLIEAGVSVPNIQQTVELYNFAASRWELFDSRAATVNDSVTQVSVTTNAGRFVDAVTGEVRARVRAKERGPVIAYPWLFRLDEARWAVSA